MFNIQVPAGNFSDEFATIAGAKKAPRRQILQGLANAIAQRYAEFQAKRQQLETVDLIERSEDEKDALRACFDDSEAFRTILRESVRMGGGNKTIRCPYCQIDVAEAWDHFLSAARYPDFAMYRPNLVYSCSRCNSTIKTDDLVAPIRRTLCPYFDPIDDWRLLRCSVECQQELSIKFAVDPEPGADPYLAQLAADHFDRYSLADKFLGETSPKVSTMKENYRSFADVVQRPLVQPELDLYIEGNLNALTKDGRSQNHWEVAFWRGAQQCPDLLNYLEEWRAAQEEAAPGVPQAAAV